MKNVENKIDPIIPLISEWKALDLEIRSNLETDDLEIKMSRSDLLVGDICQKKASTYEGFLAQLDFFNVEFGETIREMYCQEWAAILDSLSMGAAKLNQSNQSKDQFY